MTKRVLVAMSIETFVQEVIESKKGNVILKRFLFSLSILYRFAVFFKNFLYDSKILRSYNSKIPVISIGNVVVGGTGKTPFIQKLISELCAKPGSVAILSRGYKSLSENKNVLVSQGQGPLVSPSISGDEAYWLAQTTNALIWTGKDRIKSLHEAEKHKVSLVFLEDGFQHRKIYRDWDIVLLNAEDLWGKDFFLPRGYLRESPKALSRASYIIVTKLPLNFCEKSLLEAIQPFSKAPIIGFSSFFELRQEVIGKKVGAFCGIAHPSSFYRSLTGVEIVKTLTLADHELPCRDQLFQFAEECKKLGAKYLICTEKDKVKLLNCSVGLPIEVLKMHFECVWNENIWKEMILSLQTRL